jgi:hypothetical protein
MCTSLANFRSDFTIVHIPTGNFLDSREELYVNINLLRMGCSGRSALTLEEPRYVQLGFHDAYTNAVVSETTKDRFIQMYRLQDKIRTPEIFGTTVLELVKLIQAGLALFGMFYMHPDERNGLLCDSTVEGIRQWTSDIGEETLKMEVHPQSYYNARIY